jgi:hypothetical protein
MVGNATASSAVTVRTWSHAVQPMRYEAHSRAPAGPAASTAASASLRGTLQAIVTTMFAEEVERAARRDPSGSRPRGPGQRYCGEHHARHAPLEQRRHEPRREHRDVDGVHGGDTLRRGQASRARMMKVEKAWKAPPTSRRPIAVANVSALNQPPNPSLTRAPMRRARRPRSPTRATRPTPPARTAHRGRAVLRAMGSAARRVDRQPWPSPCRFAHRSRPRGTPPHSREPRWSRRARSDRAPTAPFWKSIGQTAKRSVEARPPRWRCVSLVHFA